MVGQNIELAQLHTDFMSKKVRHSQDILILFFDTSFWQPMPKNWPRRPKVRHDFDMAGEKLGMPSGSRSPELVARRLLLENLQPAQTGSAMSSYCKKR
jgi:hypothetical protein